MWLCSYLQALRSSANFQIIEGVTSESESWRPFSSIEKALCLASLGQVTIHHELAPPFLLFLHSDLRIRRDLPQRAARLCFLAWKGSEYNAGV